MTIDQVAIQLVTLRNHCRTAADLAQTAQKVRSIGYTAVQVSGIGPIPEDEIATILASEGLRICATHEPSASILDAPEKVVDRLQRLSCSLTAYPAPVGFDLKNPEQLDSLVGKLDRAGAVLRAGGITLGYHNHAVELMRFRDATVLDYIYARTDPQCLVGELDTYWVHNGGGDVVEWCQKLNGRLPFIHLKDYGVTAEEKPGWCEIGRGNLHFDRIVAAAEQSGCRWFIVEQDSTPGDPFISVRQSFEYIRDHLVSR